MEKDLRKRGNNLLIMEITHLDNFNIYQFTWNIIDSNAYVIVYDAEALIFDPIDTEEFFSFLSEKGVMKANIILTHEHFDHISGLNRLRNIMPCVVYASKFCSIHIQSEKYNLSKFANILLEGSEKDIKVNAFACNPADVIFDKELRFTWKEITLKIFLMQGHSEGSICVLMNSKYLFSGDTLLSIPTITRFPGGNSKIFWNYTYLKLKEMVQYVSIVFPGHAKIGNMKEMVNCNIIQNI